MSPSGPAHQIRTISAGHLRGKDKHAPHLPHGSIAVLSLGALGVVYGDIGTSPLYAINEIFFGHGGVAVTPENVRGCMSLVLWTLSIVVAFKYVLLVLRGPHIRAIQQQFGLTRQGVGR
jgi:K+ transporter